MADRHCYECDHNEFKKYNSVFYCRNCGSRERRCHECLNTKFEIRENGSSFCLKCSQKYSRVVTKNIPIKPRFDHMVQSNFACEILMPPAELHRRCMLSDLDKKPYLYNGLDLTLSNQKISISTLVDFEAEEFTILKNIFGEQGISLNVSYEDFMLGLNVMTYLHLPSWFLGCTTDSRLFLKGGNVESFIRPLAKKRKKFRMLVDVWVGSNTTVESWYTLAIWLLQSLICCSTSYFKAFLNIF